LPIFHLTLQADKPNFLNTLSISYAALFLQYFTSFFFLYKLKNLDLIELSVILGYEINFSGILQVYTLFFADSLIKSGIIH